MEPIAYVNGSFVPLSEAKVSILDRGFLFADGIYEVAAVLDGKLIDNASHLARLERSVGEIALPLPESVERIQEIQKELVERNKLVNGMGLLDAMRPSAYGIFITHYIFIIWLQYAVYDYAWPAFVKFAVVFIGTLSLSWAVTVMMRRIPLVARMI